MNINSKEIKLFAEEVGFDLCGITKPKVLPEDKAKFEKWLENGYQAEMSWLERNVERRTDPLLLMDEVNSIIILGLNYYQADTEEIPNGHGRVSRYARGKDYHKVIRTKIEHLLFKLNEKLGEKSDAKFKWWVDYGPFLERAYAVQAGLGYVGKNSMLINKNFGSWLFLSEIVTNLKLDPDQPTDLEHGKCAECRICIESCPTGAIVSPRTIDSSKCISYLTIERPNEIPDELQDKFGERIFGCDICQEVCPHNLSRQKETKHKEFTEKYGVGEFIDANKIIALENRDQFLKMFAGTPLVRPKEDGMKRNAEIVLKNEILNDIKKSLHINLKKYKLIELYYKHQIDNLLSRNNWLNDRFLFLLIKDHPNLIEIEKLLKIVFDFDKGIFFELSSQLDGQEDDYSRQWNDNWAEINCINYLIENKVKSVEKICRKSIPTPDFKDDNSNLYEVKNIRAPIEIERFIMEELEKLALLKQIDTQKYSYWIKVPRDYFLYENEEEYEIDFIEINKFLNKIKEQNYIEHIFTKEDINNFSRRIELVCEVKKSNSSGIIGMPNGHIVFGDEKSKRKLLYPLLNKLVNIVKNAIYQLYQYDKSDTYNKYVFINWEKTDRFKFDSELVEGFLEFIINYNRYLERMKFKVKIIYKNN